MPSGRAHLKIESGLLFGWTGLGGYLLSVRAIDEATVISFVLAYAFSMLFLSPDLDLIGSRAFQRWGPMRWIWIPYALLFRHRRLSHHPILGPLSRILYLGGLCGVVGALVVLLLGRSPVRLALPRSAIFLAVVLGLYVPNLTHVLADRVVSRWRRNRRP